MSRKHWIFNIHNFKPSVKTLKFKIYWARSYLFSDDSDIVLFSDGVDSAKEILLMTQTSVSFSKIWALV